MEMYDVCIDVTHTHAYTLIQVLPQIVVFCVSEHTSDTRPR